MAIPVDRTRIAPATWNDVLGAHAELAAWGLHPVVFGGWARELHGAWRYEGHADVDMLVTAKDLSVFDEFIASSGRAEFRPKRHHHKRAYLRDRVLVELIQVRRTPAGLATDFYGRLHRAWIEPLSCPLQTPCGTVLPVITAENIQAYERDHESVERAFFEAYPHLRAEAREWLGCERLPYDDRKLFPQ